MIKGITTCNLSEETQLFYKTSSHGPVGSSVMLHAINGEGYVTDLEKAHVYTEEQVKEEVRKGWLRSYPHKEGFLNILDIEPLATWRVDCQYLELKYPKFKDLKDEYVLYKKSCWDGNDLGFADGLSYNFDYSKSRVFNEMELTSLDFKDKWVAVPKSHTDEIKRRTFQEHNLRHLKIER
jgi:hypothetical protein